MPKKPIKRGYKIWTLTDSYAYLYDFDIYTGKTDDYVEHSLGEKVILRLTEDLQPKNHLLFFDNFFNSYMLLKILKERGIHACGTVQSNRKHPPKMTEDKLLKQGEYDYSICSDGISLIKWKDKKAVNILTNYHDPTVKSSVQRKQKKGSKIPVPCPIALVDYNSNMNFVDRFDQMKSSYDLDRKSKKWWMRIFFHFIDCCVVNSFTLYRLRGLKRLPFRRRVVDGLLAELYVQISADHETQSEASKKIKSSTRRSVFHVIRSSACKEYKTKMCQM
ncbi:piggyBac transposable element-derived protein 4-like [Anthonomus grandis grandis]|uniref:piggyBac transposable element-derived protein 4-like n=1 Tax=Anthonomus grandis grandis TaxID=2921223 RepID=UPI0021665F6F|nr:piggyBac transposable element-derived protein 4-like [Anthonomus grandis grandis]